MLENISPIAYALAAAILILAILFIGASIILGSEKTGKRVVAIELAFLFWVLFQATLSLNRWYMDQKTGALHLLFPFIFPIFIGFLLFLTPRGKKILTGINLRHLLLFQSLRFPIGIMVYMLFQSRQAPVESTFLGWNFDLFYGLLCLCAWFFFKKIKEKRAVWIAFHTLGIGLMILNMSIVFFGVPSPYQAFGFTQPFYAATHFPFSLIPTGLFSLLLGAQLLSLLPNKEA